MTTHYIKQDDTRPIFTKKLDPEIDATGAAVRFHMKNQDGGAVIVDAVATLVVANPAEVSYTFTASKTAIAGMFDAEFEVIFVGGEKRKYPNKGYDTVVIDAKLA